MLTWELTGTVIGAGLASGREVASFFSRYGIWSWAGILLAAVTLIVLAGGEFPSRWHGHWQERLWHILLSLLIAATGGAMLSGGGEVAALLLPVKGAYWGGVLITLALAWILAHRTQTGLAWVSKVLLCVLGALILLGLHLPPMRAVPINEPNAPFAVLKGISYGGFNAALQVPILAAGKHRVQSTRKSVLQAALIVGALLMLGNAVLLRHPALLSAPMPFVGMLHHYGRVGYCLGACSLYLAILSTLTACLRGLGRGLLPVVSIALVSSFGFTGVVERVYPLLGTGCFLMRAVGKFMNSLQKTFHSSKDML